VKLIEYLKNRTKKRSKLSLIIDGILILLIIIMIFPSLRRDYGNYLVRLFMTAPSVNESISIPLSERDRSLKLLTPDGKTIVLQEYLDKPIFFTWWASWCHHCIAEMKQLEKLNEKMGNRIHILVVSPENRKNALEYLQKQNSNIPLYSIISGSPEKLETRTLPTTFVIDKRGNIRFHKTGAKKWLSNEFLNFLQKLDDME